MPLVLSVLYSLGFFGSSFAAAGNIFAGRMLAGVIWIMAFGVNFMSYYFTLRFFEDLDEVNQEEAEDLVV